MASFQELEEQDAVRLPWNIWPSSRVGTTKCVVPMGALYSVNKTLPNMPVVPYEPVGCKTCGAMLNPYATVDFNSKIWICPFCHARNHFPAHYQGVSESNLPAELFPSYATIEYTLPRSIAPGPPAYVFLIDTGVDDERELEACRTAVLQALQLIPETSSVGLITYGTHVQVHELGFAECQKSYVFRGSKEYTPEQIAEQLGLANRAVPMTRTGAPGPVHANGGAAPAASRFVVPLGECEFQISGVLDELQRDCFPPVAEHRAARCTGTALQVAAGMMRACLPSSGNTCRLMLFVGGPCTEGPGKVVSRELAEHMRSHKDLAKDTAPYYRKAVKLYASIADMMIAQGHTFDLFLSALDQVGLAEMKEIVERTGGMAVQTDTFTNPVFKDSFKRMFAKEGDPGFLGVSSGATFEVIPSRNIKVAGLFGPAARLERKTAHASENEMGLGSTTLWRLNGMDTQTTLCVLFDVTNASSGKGDPNMGPDGQQLFYLQFISRYFHYSGTQRCRVTTIARQWTADDNLSSLISGFDQEAACALMARVASYKMEVEEDFDATRWLDRSLIRLASRFGEYRKDDPQSFSLRPEMSYFPQFMFNLRRSQFVQLVGTSPDETAYCRLMLNRSPVGSAMLMIQPQVTSYSFNGPPEPALLDVQSIQPDRLLYMDAFFYVVVFHGTTIAQWRESGYHEKEEHKAFAEMLSAPQRLADEVCKSRFPVPRYVDCDQHGSQARFFLARLNPSATYNSAQVLSSEVLMTDDVNLHVFSEHLRKLAVQS
ncbi:hypothetical protein BSKO_06456 [Bryopsis sp. KO-2023]|nr:hypothetical protein BSKO_06456 [Bryopsis sp. KO-2023]